jgi:hypothetical protein
MPLRIALAALALVAVVPPAPSLASDSPHFDRSCVIYYRQGNDPEVPEIAASNFCACLGEWYAKQDLGADALDFFGRTYSEDLTEFIQEYPDGEAWMEESFRADVMCKSG